MTTKATLSGIEDVLNECGVTETTLAPAEKESLDRRGYVILPDVIEGGWLARLRTAFENAIGKERTTGGGQQSGTRHANDLIQKDEAFEGVLTHPKILGAVFHVLRRSFKVLVLGGRDPLPGYGQQGLHSDWYPRTSFDEPFSVVTTIWLLDEFIENNGATRLIPGSHLTLKPLPKPMQQPGSNHPDQTLIVAKAGSALVFNGHLWHSGTRNESNRTRRVLQCQFVAREMVRPAEIQSNIPEHLTPAARYLMGV
ncbi:MAG TPA: phytanoyl-CoA dioxygenase family protein [Blastocatellia bacterium]|nr:phytanoyl-CoA dioxygenase family protein [Blastocatellia bacterium]